MIVGCRSSSFGRLAVLKPAKQLPHPIHEFLVVCSSPVRTVARPYKLQRIYDHFNNIDTLDGAKRRVLALQASFAYRQVRSQPAGCLEGCSCNPLVIMGISVRQAVLSSEPQTYAYRVGLGTIEIRIHGGSWVQKETIDHIVNTRRVLLVAS